MYTCAAEDRSGRRGWGTASRLHPRLPGAWGRAVLRPTFFIYNTGQRGRAPAWGLSPPGRCCGLGALCHSARTPRSPKHEESLRAGPRVQVTQELG